MKNDLQIIVVDENDNVIGSKSRDEIDYSKDIYRVSCLWVTNPKGEVLLAQRRQPIRASSNILCNLSAPDTSN